MPALKLDDNHRRQEAITSLFTKDEKELIIKAALAKGIPPGILVRHGALREAGLMPKAIGA